MGNGETFRLGDWTVDADRCLVENGRQQARLKPKAMAVLMRLVAARGAVVSRSDLFDAVWPNSEVTDDVLTRCVVELRKAFRDSAKSPAYIETIPRKGLRLIPEPLPASPAAPADDDGTKSMPVSRPKRLRGLLAASLACMLVIAAIALFDRPTAAPRDKSVAVLPFVDMSAGGDQEFFADGITEELINELVKLDGLSVTGRTSSFFFKGRNEDLRSIGEQLNVAHVLEGSVRLSGDTLRITAQLIDVRDGFHLWSASFDRRQADIFDIQSEIAESVARALSIELGVGKLARYTGGTDNVDAHELVLRGNARYKEGSEEDANDAIESFRLATELDPDYAIAWERLASAYLYGRLVFGGDYWSNARELAQESIDRALELGPDSSIVLQTAAYNEVVQGDFFEARGFFERLSNADVSIPLARSGTYIDMMLKTGHIDEALRLQRQNMLIDPKREENAMYLAHTLTADGRIDDALEALETAWANGQRDSGLANEGLVAALHRDDDALLARWLERASAHAPQHFGDSVERIARVVGDRGATVALLYELFNESPNYDYVVALFAARVDERELVMRAFRRSTDLWIFWYPLMAPVRASKEFAELVNDLGLARYWREYGPNDFCSVAEAERLSCV